MFALDYNLIDFTILDILGQTLFVIDLNLNKNMNKFVNKCMNYLSKMVQIDYDI